MKAHLKKLQLKTTPLFKFEEKKAHGSQPYTDPTLTITVTGETILTSVLKTQQR